MVITNSLRAKFDYGQFGQQFTPPYCFEFAGKTINLVFDNYSAEACFLDKRLFKWNDGIINQETEYWCLKLVNDIYMVSFGLTPEICMTLILDMVKGLVTLDKTAFDDEHRPRIKTVDFGAVIIPGKPVCKERHEYTKELAGNTFKWIFCDTYWHRHVYHENTCELSSNLEFVKGEGPYKAVKITDTVFYNIAGDDKESYCELINIKCMTLVGRSVIWGNNGKAIAMGAVGKFDDGNPEFVDLVFPEDQS